MMKKSLFGFLLLMAGSITFLTAQNKKLTVDDLQNTKLYPKTLQNLQWIPGEEVFSYSANNSIIRVNALKDAKDTLVRLADLNKEFSKKGNEKLRKLPAITWQNAATFTFLNKNKLYRYEWATATLDEINSWNEKGENLDVEPINKRVAYTIDNNLFIADKGSEIVVTSDKDKGIVNGSERVHRNEWGITKGTFWSPSGNLLAYYRMDETMVAGYPLVDITTPIAEVNETKYPMAGTVSHQVSLCVFNVKTRTTVLIKTGEPREQFLTNITWSPDEKFIFIAVLNREQNHMWLNQYDAETGLFVKTLFEETNPRYVEPLHPLSFLKKNPKQFIYQSQRDGFNHLYLYDISGKLIRQVTSGSWVVTGFLGCDPNDRFAFYTSTSENPLGNQVYMTGLQNGKTRKISMGEGIHSPLFNDSFSWMIDQRNSMNSAAEYSLIAVKNNQSRIIQAGDNPLKDYQLGKTRVFPLKAKDGTLLYSRLILPPDFDSTKKYPVIIYVYGGPHSQLINNGWLAGAGMFLNYLALKGYIVFTLDNRGSANRGFEFESCIHRNLGVIEMQDQLEGVSYLKSLTYVDSTRLGIDGWSYGGFMTLNMVLKNPGLFKVAFAGGPVVDWKYYEIMYGERYMDKPEENPEGYKNADLLNLVDNLQGKLLIVHGTMDATVVWQNSLMFIKKCIEAGKQVDYFVYPGHEHNVRGKDRIHLFQKQVMYFDDYLK